MNVLVAGGTGYIGSNTVVSLLESGHEVVIVDNLSNSDKNALADIKLISGKDVPFYDLDVRDKAEITNILKTHAIDAVIHFAALKSVGESITKATQYYDNNVGGLISILEACNECGVKKFIFSSSATVYGDPQYLPIDEEHPLGEATNPYGATKQMGERILTDTSRSSDLDVVLLRYFNPVGAREGGVLGELPKGTPNNLIPYLTQATAKVIEPLVVYGTDYDTPDGSGVRDYVHVVDLADAHVAALDKLSGSHGLYIYNIGTGKGTSVLELIKLFEEINGVTVPYSVGPRRQGDIASCFATAKKANKELGWSAKLSIQEALSSAWQWQNKQR